MKERGSLQRLNRQSVSKGRARKGAGTLVRDPPLAVKNQEFTASLGSEHPIICSLPSAPTSPSTRNVR